MYQAGTIIHVYRIRNLSSSVRDYDGCVGVAVGCRRCRHQCIIIFFAFFFISPAVAA